MSAPDAGSGTAAELRAAFDREFAAAPAPDAPAHADLLRVRIGGEAYVIQLAELAGCHTDQSVVPLPSPAPELLGVAAVRGALVPVYDLRALLGLAAAAGGAPRWLAIARGTPVLGFAFDSVDGHARIDRTALPFGNAAGAGQAHTGVATLPARGTILLEGRLHQVLDLGQLRSQILTRWEPRT